MEKIKCTIERITYQNPENGYSVLQATIKGYRDEQTLMGKNMLAILSTNNEGEVFEAYSLAVVKIDKGKYGYVSLKTFGDKETAVHFYKLIIGEKKWRNGLMMMRYIGTLKNNIRIMQKVRAHTGSVPL